MAWWFRYWKNSAGFIWPVNNNGSIDVKMDGSVLEKESSFKMLGLTYKKKYERVLGTDDVICFVLRDLPVQEFFTLFQLNPKNFL